MQQIELVKLISSDGHEFILDKKVAMGSKLVKSMLEGDGFLEAESSEITFSEIYGILLEKIVDYLHYRARANACSQSEKEAPKIEKGIALDLLLASDFLGV